MITPDRDALLVALVLVPASYSRNRFFELYQDATARRMRRRAAMIRSIVRHVAADDALHHGDILAVVPLTSGGIELTYQVPAMGLRRTTRLEPLEMALIRFAIARARATSALAPPLASGDADRLRIEAALQRLAEPPAGEETLDRHLRSLQMCLFCKMVKKEIPAKVLFEDDEIFAFHDINPQAPTHVLVIPKRHIVSIADATPEDAAIFGKLLLGAKRVAVETGIDKTGFRTVINNGQQAGQSVFHVHMHVLGGRPMAWPPG